MKNTTKQHECLSYSDTTDAILSFLEVRKHASDAFFFESAPSIDAEPDFSIIGFGPYEVLQDTGEHLKYTVNKETALVSNSSFFLELKKMIEALKKDDRNSACRYQNGGVFGCIGYDAVSEIESRLKDAGYFRKLCKDRNFSDLRSEVMIVKKMIVFDHKNRRIDLIDAATDQGDITVEKMATFLVESKDHDPPAPFNENEAPPLSEDRLIAALGYEEFKKRVETIKEHVREGDIFQAVIAERFECRIKAEPIRVFVNLRKINPSPYSFFFSFSDRCFFGASPEALIRIAGNRVISHPIAGTRRRGKNESEDRLMRKSLSRSRKEAAEHLMLVDLARNDLGRIAAPGTVRVNDFRSIRYLSNVMHLVSEVEAEMAEGTHALEALQACFPAGTLSGAPKMKAMEILSNLETVPRGLYGGAVVAFDSIGNLDSCIAIRSLETKEDQAVLRAGAGIVADSKAKHEYAEISHKLKALKEAIASAEAEVLL